MERFLKQCTRAALGVALAAVLLAGCAGQEAGQSASAPPMSESAAQTDGAAVEQLLDGVEQCTLEPEWRSDFAARVFKITRDERGERLTWLKVTGGQLRVREVLHGPDWE